MHIKSWLNSKAGLHDKIAPVMLGRHYNHLIVKTQNAWLNFDQFDSGAF